MLERLEERTPAGALTLSVNPLAFTEAAGSSPLALATLTDSDGDTNAADFAVWINYGDGSAPVQASLVWNGSAFQVMSGHTFSEEGSYNVTISVTDSDGAQASAQQTVAVSDAPLSNTGVASSLTATTSQPFTQILGSFLDANPFAGPGNFAAAIDWGHGDQSPGTITGSNGTFTVSGATTFYAAGSPAITVTVTDADGAAVTIYGTATVADAALQGTAATLNTTAGVALNGVVAATFTDAYAGGSAADYTANINWGDGTTSAGVVDGSDGNYDVRGSHTYAAAGSYAVAITLTDAGASAAATGSAQVSRAPTYNVMNFTYYDLQNPNGAPASAYTATIYWGDATSSTTGTVSGGNGAYQVYGSHVYAEEGTYNVALFFPELRPLFLPLFFPFLSLRDHISPSNPSSCL